MKFRLKTLFAITVLVAIVVYAISSDQRALAKVRRMRAAVDSTLGNVERLNNDDIARSEFRSDFVLFSSGTISWELVTDDPMELRIALEWRSRMFFSDGPSVTITPKKSRKSRQFAEELLRDFQRQKLDVSIDDD